MDESLLQRYISQQSAVWKALLDKRESLTLPLPCWSRSLIG